VGDAERYKYEDSAETLSMAAAIAEVPAACRAPQGISRGIEQRVARMQAGIREWTRIPLRFIRATGDDVWSLTIFRFPPFPALPPVRRHGEPYLKHGVR